MQQRTAKAIGQTRFDPRTEASADPSTKVTFHGPQGPFSFGGRGDSGAGNSLRAAFQTAGASPEATVCSVKLAPCLQFCLQEFMCSGDTLGDSRSPTRQGRQAELRRYLQLSRKFRVWQGKNSFVCRPYKGRRFRVLFRVLLDPIDRRALYSNEIRQTPLPPSTSARPCRAREKIPAVSPTHMAAHALCGAVSLPRNENRISAPEA